MPLQLESLEAYTQRLPSSPLIDLNTKLGWIEALVRTAEIGYSYYDKISPHLLPGQDPKVKVRGSDIPHMIAACRWEKSHEAVLRRVMQESCLVRHRLESNR